MLIKVEKIVDLVRNKLGRFAESSAQQILDFAATQQSTQQSKGWQSLSALPGAGKGKGEKKELCFHSVLWQMNPGFEMKSGVSSSFFNKLQPGFAF